MNRVDPRYRFFGLIFPIYKTGDPLNPSNYRGIAITSCLSKLFNSILNARLEKYILKNELIKMLSEPLLLPFFNFFVASVTSFAETGKSNSFIRSLDLSKSFIEQNQCPNVSLNNQREITILDDLKITIF
jgi:hypothetical protein